MKHLRVLLMSENVVTCGESEAEMLTQPLRVSIVSGPVNDLGSATVIPPLCAEIFRLNGCDSSAFCQFERTVLEMTKIDTE